ncbi:DUF1211 domain-containing protein [Candidatus Gracilibacteria bacterium]|nr:DUF1211 domain-containing protein [Candidatus Gracilibacteria bacterium]
MSKLNVYGIINTQILKQNKNTMNNKNIRINSLTDGVFAIIMTLLVLDVKVPEFTFTPTSNQLSRAVWQLLPDMASFFISFVLLATYWMAHNYIFLVT